MSTPGNDIRAAIADVIDQFMVAFARGSSNGVAALYTEDAQLFPPGMPMVAGKAAIAAFWYGAMGSGIKGAKLQTVELNEYSDTAVEIGTGMVYDAAGTIMDRIKYVVVWKQEGGQWKLHRDIWNSDGAPAA